MIISNKFKTGSFLVILMVVCFTGFAQKAKTTTSTNLKRPALVVGIVVDQMRWDYLYRYYNRYTEKGLKRLLEQGFSCENTFINHLPSATAVGHSTIYTGTVPAIHGITGNSWTERLTGKHMYCTDDSTVKTVGTVSHAGEMSPRNLLTTTISDELRIATNFESRVIGISLKDRASILPVGHTATAAFWLDDKSGNFITSTYYMGQLPEWVNQFNGQKNIEKLIAKGWNTLYPIETYKASTEDDITWEGKFEGETSPVFPRNLANMYKASRGAFRRTPFGNTFTLEFAKAAVDANHLGNGKATDFLAVNLASTDYVGHMFGPNAVEMEDTYLRLDQDLGSFFDHLDKNVGKGNYLVFLTADHGASNSIEYNKKYRISADILNPKALLNGLNKHLEATFNTDSLVKAIDTYQVYFDHDKINKKHTDFSRIKDVAVNYIRQQQGVAFAVDLDKILISSIPGAIQTFLTNSYNYKRGGDIQIINEPGWFTGRLIGTNHGTWNPYDTHIPLLFMGWGVKPGFTNRQVYMTDIAPTIAAFLHIQMPSGSIGSPIVEVLQK